MHSLSDLPHGMHFTHTLHTRLVLSMQFLVLETQLCGRTFLIINGFYFCWYSDYHQLVETDNQRSLLIFLPWHHSWPSPALLAGLGATSAHWFLQVEMTQQRWTQTVWPHERLCRDLTVTCATTSATTSSDVTLLAVMTIMPWTVRIW